MDERRKPELLRRAGAGETTPPHGWRRAVDRFIAERVGPGDFVSDAWFDEACGLDPIGVASEQQHRKRSLARFALISKWQEALLHRLQVALRRSDKHDGWDVLNASEHFGHTIDEGRRRMKGAARFIAQNLTYTDTAKLSDRERQHHADAAARFAKLRLLVARELKALPGPDKDDDEDE